MKKLIAFFFGVEIQGVRFNVYESPEKLVCGDDCIRAHKIK